MGNATACLHIQDLEVEAALGLRMLTPLLADQGRPPGPTAGCFAVSTMCRPSRCRCASSCRPTACRLSAAASSRTGSTRNASAPQEVPPAPIVPSSASAEDTVVALYAGNMGSKQGVGSLAEVARLCRDIDHLHFVFAGDGSLRDRGRGGHRGIWTTSRCCRCSRTSASTSS